MHMFSILAYDVNLSIVSQYRMFNRPKKKKKVGCDHYVTMWWELRL